MRTVLELAAALGIDVAADPQSNEEQYAEYNPDWTITPQYDGRLSHLLISQDGKWQRVLNDDLTGLGFPSASEAIYAVIWAMKVRWMTCGECLKTLEASRIYADRVARKGGHAEYLVLKEIRDAHFDAERFPDDPGEGFRRVGVKPLSTHTVTVEQIAPAVLQADTKPDPTRVEEQSGCFPIPDSGFLGEYVHYAMTRTDAPAQAHALMAVAALSALAGPRPRLPLATAPEGVRLTIWALYIVNSTVGRKSTVLDLATDIVRCVLSDDLILSWEGSPQGLIQRMQAHDGQAMVFARDEYTGLLKGMNRGGHLAGLSELLIKAFDGKRLENVRTKKRGIEDTDRVDNPYLVQMAAAVQDQFLQSCTITNITDGFLPRFIIATAGTVQPKPMPRLTNNMAFHRHAVIDGAIAFHEKAQKLGLLEMSPDVDARHWEVEQAWEALALKTGNPSTARPALKRLAEVALKTAALIAIDEAAMGTAPCIELRHYETALAMVEYWRTSTLEVIANIGQTTFMRDTEAVCETIVAHPAGIKQGALSRIHRHIRSRDLDEILGRLQEQEQIEIVTVKTQPGQRGRPPRILYPYGHAPAAE
jgi:hypothetical protein